MTLKDDAETVRDIGLDADRFNIDTLCMNLNHDGESARCKEIGLEDVRPEKIYFFVSTCMLFKHDAETSRYQRICVIMRRISLCRLILHDFKVWWKDSQI